MGGPSSFSGALGLGALGLSDDVDGDLNRRSRSPVLEPVEGVPVLGPAHSGPVVVRDSVSMVGDRSLQDEDDARPARVVVDRTEDPARFDGHHAHAKLASCHALDLTAEVNRRVELHRDPFPGPVPPVRS